MAKDEPAVIEADDGGVFIDYSEQDAAEKRLANADNQAAPAEPTVVEVAEPAAPAEPAVPDAIAELRSQLRAAEDRRLAAESERRRAEQAAHQMQQDSLRFQEEARRANTEVLDSRRSEVDSGIAAAAAQAESAKRRYQSALDAGDSAGITEANAVLNEAIARKLLLESHKASLGTTERPSQTTTGRVEAQQQNQISDPVERYIADKSPRVQGWLRKHTDCVTDQRMNNKTVAAHYEAVAEGHVPETDAYFDFLDRKLGFAAQPATEPAAVRTVSEPADPPARKPAQRQAPPAAPVSRESPRDQQLGNGRIYLTRSEIETAESLGLSPAEYGKRKAAMQKQGFYH